MVGVRWVHSWYFDVANWTSASIVKNHLLWLVASKIVDARDHCIWHRDNNPTTPNNFLSCVERHKFKAVLQVSTGPKRNGALCSGVLDIARSIFLVQLTVLSNMETQVIFCNQESYWTLWFLGSKCQKFHPLLGRN